MMHFADIPELRDPVVLAAFEGWNDAGECASAVVEHLRRVWDAELVASIDPEDYYDMQVNRPQVLNNGGERVLRWPTTRVFVARNSPLGRGVVLIQGIEPSIRWRTFSGELLDFVIERGATMLITLGGLLADVPHTRPIPVSMTSEDTELREQGIAERSTHEGPTGIVGVLGELAHRRDLPSLSAWAAVPHYAGGPPSPKATLALIGALEELLGCVIDDTDVIEASRAWERGVDELAASDDEVAEYVASLEDAQDTADLPEATGDAIAKEFERYLRKRGEDGSPRG
ncbi:PAC2 family protein [Ornithinimicrobium sp. Y1694]|uniref:PAC2 family protein n=1 Tax=Ornithinimicrobium sp. Y1694 TaxID=3418590 RepID=UPI003CEF80FE